MKNNKKIFEKIAVYALGGLTTGSIIAGYMIGNDNYYLAAFVFGFIFFRITTGSSCPFIWMFTKMGVKGLSCPTDFSKQRKSERE